MNASDDHRRKATSWAILTLTALNCCVDAQPDGSWYVETIAGWQVADNWQALCRIAREQHAAHRCPTA